MVAAAAASYKTYTPQHSVRTDASVFPDVAYMLRALFSHLPLPQSLKIMMAFRRWASTRASSQSAESTPLFFITPLHVPPTSLFVSNSFESEVEIPSFPSYRLSVPAFLTSFFFLFSLPRNFLAVSFVCGAISKHFFFGCCCSRRGALFKFLSHSGK